MDALAEVLKDLSRFVFIEHFGVTYKTETLSEYSQAVTLVPGVVSVPAPVLLPALPPPKTNKNKLLSKKVFVSVPEASLFISPNIAYDSILYKLNYGTELKVLSYEEGWYEVLVEADSGWILEDLVTVENVFPKFKLGQRYNEINPETIKLRAYIGDDFKGQLLDLTLTDAEYVSYKLKKLNKIIPWDKRRPRLAGKWKNLLKGKPGVHIGVTPKKGSIMEFGNSKVEGHVAFVEEVFNDESIVISEVGWPESGQYSERTFPLEEWREYRPVFIEIA